MGLDGAVRVDLADGFGEGGDLRHADAAGGVGDLALQVGEVHHVVIDHADGADAGSGEVERQGGA